MPAISHAASGSVGTFGSLQFLQGHLEPSQVLFCIRPNDETHVRSWTVTGLVPRRRERVQEIVFRFFTSRGGTFRFVLADRRDAPKMLPLPANTIVLEVLLRTFATMT